MKVKWKIDDSQSIPDILDRYLEKKPEELNAFINLWVDRWLEKWRERVRILHKKPTIPKFRLERAENAKEIYGKMDHSRELKDTLIRKLINQGEICMAEQIAENLIVEEIAKNIPRTDEGREMTSLNPLEILNNLTPRISRLSKEKGPLVYLRIKMGLF